MRSRELAASAIMAAMVAVATFLIQIPIPATQGFFNVGDSMIMVAALTFGPIVGAIAGGLGSALGDFLGGWYVWVPFTLVIKGAEGFIAGWVLSIVGEEKRNFHYVIAWMAAGVEMVVGYFIVQTYMYGFGAALIELPVNFVQMLVGGIIGIPLAAALNRITRKM